ncbi:glycosyl transferase family 1 [Paenibacillus riograndensis]|uniref:Glycosyl transferase family 1 n=1 Tax=Paenibacillus riograndensis TaxID=483937 RepID=A0A132UAH0_9BACL|nr:glycosyltransferase family 4 protein [Paenibacillus riograndensis]KWX80530.1 glycosyl transferase family 1 [Paenibacillus riograndensis]
MNYIVYSGELDIRKGGPAGYIANLQKGLNNIQEDKIRIISKKNLGNVISGKSRFDFLRSIIGKSDFMVEMLSMKKFVHNRDSSIANELNLIEFTENDVVHVHSVLDFLILKKYNIRANVILTPHTPESISEELVEAAKFKFRNARLTLEKYKRKIKLIEEMAFEECDHFIFPSKESMEIFSTFIEGFNKKMENKNIYFNLTSCDKLTYNLNKNEFKEQFKITEDKFIISYVGRHNRIKGYDLFVEMAKKVYEIDKNIIFIVGGTGEIESDSSNIIDIGWTNDPGSIINTSDIFVLPNRNTYFDLILLEVLSIGTPVVASNTGGNKTVNSMTNGVALFENGNVEELVSIVLELKCKKDVLIQMKEDNLNCYQNNFTLNHFASRYNDILSKINEFN